MSVVPNLVGYLSIFISLSSVAHCDDVEHTLALNPSIPQGELTCTEDPQVVIDTVAHAVPGCDQTCRAIFTSVCARKSTCTVGMSQLPESCGLDGESQDITVTYQCKKASPVTMIAIFDRSRSVLTDPDFFARAKDFLKAIFSRLDLGEDATVTAAYTFSVRPLLKWDFTSSTSTNLNEIYTAIDNFKAPRGDTRTCRALNRARILLKLNERECACKSVLLITDGATEGSCNSELEANRLRDETGARMCVVEFRGENESPSQQRNRDVTLQRMKGPAGALIGSNMFHPDAFDSAVDQASACLQYCPSKC